MHDYDEDLPTHRLLERLGWQPYTLTTEDYVRYTLMGVLDNYRVELYQTNYVRSIRYMDYFVHFHDDDHMDILHGDNLIAVDACSCNSCLMREYKSLPKILRVLHGEKWREILFPELYPPV